MVRYSDFSSCYFTIIKSFSIVSIGLFGCTIYGQFNYQKQWSTYYFGSNTEYDGHSAIDTQGNIVVAGSISPSILNTSTTQYEPVSYYDQWATSGAHQPHVAVNATGTATTDCFITKFNPDGTVQWSTYFGGENTDFIANIALDSNDNIYIVGFTNSTSGIATTGAYISDFSVMVAGATGSTSDLYQGFLAKFSPSGVLQWATYIPAIIVGGSISRNLSLAIAADNAVFVVSDTIAANAGLITTTGAYQEVFYSYPTADPVASPNRNGYILKFNGLGNRVAGTLYGSALASYAITTDSDNNIIAVGAQGITPEVLATPGSYQTTQPGLGRVGFVSKFAPNLSSKIWCTYYGTGGNNQVELVTTLGTDIFFYGRCVQLDSGDLATTGAFSETPSNGFMAKFTGTGARVWGTYLPFVTFGTFYSVYDLKIANNKMYLAGATRTTTGVSTTGAYQSNLATPNLNDGYMMQFTTDGVRNWGSYFGGERWDIAKSINIVNDTTFYIYGNTNSATAISSPNSIQPNMNYGSSVVNATTTYNNVPYNMFLAKFSSNLGIPTIVTNSLQLTPNPSKGQFVLSGNLNSQYDNAMQLIIYDYLGKEITKQNVAPFQNEMAQAFNFSGLLSSGIYFAKLSAGQELVQTFKVVIN